MERELKTIKLSNGEEVKLLTYLTWGEKEKFNSAVIKGAKIDSTGLSGIDTDALLASKYSLLEICIKDIVSNGASKPFSKEWMDALSVNDGDLIYDEVDQMTKKKV